MPAFWNLQHLAETSAPWNCPWHQLPRLSRQAIRRLSADSRDAQPAVACRRVGLQASVRKPRDQFRNWKDMKVMGKKIDSATSFWSHMVRFFFCKSRKTILKDQFMSCLDFENTKDPASLMNKVCTSIFIYNCNC